MMFTRCWKIYKCWIRSRSYINPNFMVNEILLILAWNHITKPSQHPVPIPIQRRIIRVHITLQNSVTIQLIVNATYTFYNSKPTIFITAIPSIQSNHQWERHKAFANQGAPPIPPGSRAPVSVALELKLRVGSENKATF